MAGQTPTNASSGIAFLVSSGIMYEVVAACCSSPQTTELNADKRAPTLMKWVGVGLAQGSFFVLAAALIDRKHAGPILAGGALAGAILYVSYAHAKQAGLDSCEPGTESY